MADMLRERSTIVLIELGAGIQSPRLWDEASQVNGHAELDLSRSVVPTVKGDFGCWWGDMAGTGIKMPAQWQAMCDFLEPIWRPGLTWDELTEGQFQEFLRLAKALPKGRKK